MTRIEYDLLRSERPELQLPDWFGMPPHWRQFATTLTRERLIARRTAVLLAREFGYTWDSFNLHPIGDETGALG